jgi:TPR repeat protein
MRNRFFVVAVVLLATTCSPAPKTKQTCIADSIGTLKNDATVPNCAERPWLCRLNCVVEDGASCAGLAYHLEGKPETEAEALRFYRRACLLGVASGCTNYAATIWSANRTGPELPCVQRTFEKACAAKDPFACGMVGRLMLESAPSPDFAAGRKYLEQACNNVSGFPCRVLAKHLETGKLGEYDPQLIRTLLTEACNGGDPGGCGNPRSAAATFR